MSVITEIKEYCESDEWKEITKKQEMVKLMKEIIKDLPDGLWMEMYDSIVFRK